MARLNDLSCFSFKFAGAGHYWVKYTTPWRGDYWRALITDMTLIDATKNAEWSKGADIKRLKNAIKRNGTHYSKNGDKIN